MYALDKLFDSFGIALIRFLAELAEKININLMSVNVSRAKRCLAVEAEGSR